MMQEHVWLTEEFSVRKETLCFHPKTIVPRGADWRTTPRQATGAVCVLGKGHKGKHAFAIPDVRLYPFTESPL